MPHSVHGLTFSSIAAPIAALFICASGSAQAQAVDYTELFKTKVLKCVHPTVNPDKASYEVVKGPDKAGDVTTVRFKIFYEGLVKKNSMDADLMIRQSGSIRQVKVAVLADSGTGLGRCAMEKDWADF